MSTFKLKRYNDFISEKKAVDLNGDGKVDSKDWMIARDKAIKKAMKEHEQTLKKMQKCKTAKEWEEYCNKMVKESVENVENDTNKPLISIDIESKSVSYILELDGKTIELNGSFRKYNTGRSEEVEFELDGADEDSENWYSENWENVDEELQNEYTQILYKRHKKLKESVDFISESYGKTTKKYKDVKIVYTDDIKDMSPLHYVYSEYPTYKHMKNGRLQFSYEFYETDKGDVYFVYSGSRDVIDEFKDFIESKIDDYKKGDGRNVDTFVKNADKEDYKQWKKANEGFDSKFDEINSGVVLDNYLEAAIWTDEDTLQEEADKLGIELDANIYNVDAEFKQKSLADIESFISKYADTIKESGMSDDQLGHDLWLTRNRHGAGFWDRGYDEEIGKILTDGAKELGTISLFLKEDGEISGA